MPRWRPSRRSRRARLPEPTDEERALALAYRHINRRERTTAEVRTRLERAELAREAIDAAITELTEFGYLDDARYARVFTEDKRTLEEWGRARIERALSQRGIGRELIESALGSSRADGLPGETEQARALELLRRRFPAPPENRRARERALGVLLRKGYDSDTAYDAIRAWAHGPEGETP